MGYFHRDALGPRLTAALALLSKTFSWLVGYRSPKHFSFEAERFVPERFGIARHRLFGQASSVHRVNPFGCQLLYPVHDPTHGLLRGEASHAATLVGLEVGTNNVGEACRVENLCHGFTHTFIHRKHAGVDQGRAFVVDEELIELKLRLLVQGGDPIDPRGYFVDVSHDISPFHSFLALTNHFTIL